MKKSLAYIATALVLGTVLMLTPIWLFPTITPYGAAPNIAEAAQKLSRDTEAFAGVRVNQPIDTISVSLMLTASLAVALGTSLYLKKKMPNNAPV